MNDELVFKVAGTLTVIIKNALKNHLIKETTGGATEDDTPDHVAEDTSDEIVKELSEHIVIELTKALVERARRTNIEETPSVSGLKTVQKLSVEVSEKISSSLNSSEADLANKISNANIILNELHTWGKKSIGSGKKAEFNALLLQLSNTLR